MAQQAAASTTIAGKQTLVLPRRGKFLAADPRLKYPTGDEPNPDTAPGSIQTRSNYEGTFQIICKDQNGLQLQFIVTVEFADGIYYRPEGRLPARQITATILPKAGGSGKVARSILGEKLDFLVTIAPDGSSSVKVGTNAEKNISIELPNESGAAQKRLPSGTSQNYVEGHYRLELFFQKLGSWLDPAIQLWIQTALEEKGLSDIGATRLRSRFR